MVDDVGITKYAYTAGNQLLTEDGPWASDTVTNSYVNRQRTALALQQPTGYWNNGFVYDQARRLSIVVMSAGTFVYTYPNNSASFRPVKLLLPNTSFITNTYDSVARMMSTKLLNSALSPLDSYA